MPSNTSPPGLVFLYKNLLSIATPPSLVYLAAILAERFAGVHVHAAIVALGMVLSFPAAFFISVAVETAQWSRKAAARDAVVPPYMTEGLPPVGKTSFPRHVLFQCYEKYGPIFILNAYYLKRIFIAEPDHIKAILATDFASFEKGPALRAQLRSLLGVGVFNADGDLWKFHRSMTRPFFTKDRISHFNIFDRHAQDALSHMWARLESGYAVDWQDLVSRFTLDSATEFLFGHDVRSLSTVIPYPPTSNKEHERDSSADAFSKAFSVAQTISANRGRSQQAWPLLEFWHDKVEEQKKVINAYIEPIIRNALDQKAQRAKSGNAGAELTDDDTLLSHLVESTDDADVIRDETLNILLAGRDTTACTLTFAIYRLSQNPGVLQRLREEILSVVGPENRPTYDDIRQMKFLRAVINETLRLHPPVPINVRASVKDTTLPAVTPGGKDFFVPAGMKCIYSVFVMHRRKDLWGPDALVFDPDRFIDERLHKYLTPHPFIFLPFNAGPRICLGQQFAYNETSFMLVRLLQQVSSIAFVPEVSLESVAPEGYTDAPGAGVGETVLMDSHLTAYAKGGLWIKATRVAPSSDNA